jgi:hypothetical protein
MLLAESLPCGLAMMESGHVKLLMARGIAAANTKANSSPLGLIQSLGAAAIQGAD